MTDILTVAREAYSNYGHRSDGDAVRICRLAQAVIDLSAAIAKHRDQNGDDRCYLDDAELYAAIGDKPTDQTLPPKEEFLANCERYWECRKSGVKYASATREGNKNI